MKKVAIVGTVGIPACYGGFESLVENLANHSSSSVKYTIFCSERNYKIKLDSYKGADLIYLNLNANGVQSVIYDIWSLIKCLWLKPDVVLILGVSGCLFLPIFNIFSKSKVITNIDGLEWKREKWGKLAKIFLKLSEKIGVKHSDFVVTDNKAIGDYVSHEYGIDSKTIAYGGDHAIRDINIEKNKNVYALGLCRIEPENNVKMILRAYSLSGGRLKFVGNWNFSEFGRKLKIKYDCFENIELIDPIYALDELFVLRRNCSIYIHGHSAGGTNPSLVEMMHFGVPILAFDCQFNRYSTEDKCVYFKDESQIVNILNHMDVEKIKDVGVAMKEIALRRYTWGKVSNSYEELY